MVIRYYPQRPFRHAHSTRTDSNPASPLFDFDTNEEILTCYPGPLRQPDHFGTVRPSMFDMQNPLLARDTRATPVASEPPRRSSLNSANFLQLQTSAAVSRPAMRRHSQPLQNLLDVGSKDGREDKASSADCSRTSSMSESPDEAPSSDSASPFTPPEPPSPGTASRCSRCKRTPSIDHSTIASKMVQYGLNQFYCSQCAQMVGLGPR